MPDPIAPSPAPGAPQGLFGGTWIATSGSTSGTLSSVDYAYYSQSLEIDYVRKPDGYTTNGTTTTYSLSSTSGTEYVTMTDLHIFVTAKNSCKKIPQAPGNPSGYTQMQKFAIYNVSTDQYGGSGYGGSALSAYTFGPRGKVYTTQPFIWMTVWDTARDTEYSVKEVGTNKNLLDTSNLYWKPSKLGDPYPWYTNQETISDTWATKDWHYRNHGSNSPNGNFWLAGPYNIAQEPKIMSRV